MAANGISTHEPKSERPQLKLELAKTQRQGTPPGNTLDPKYRVLNVVSNPITHSPVVGRPWEPGV